MTLQSVKLSDLRLSPLNVRKVKPAAIDQLAADIAAHGLLQNLVVYADGGKFAVAAGGRRYRALKQLEKAKAIPACHAVPVDVRERDEAIELSLAENSSREAMHCADAVTAYGALLEQGLSAEDIAARFGEALSYVRKVLRLAALCPEALKALAKDEIGMEAAQALTLTDDQDKQREALKRYGNQAHAVRRFLTEAKIGTGHALFLFVGETAYRAAGGSITADLFSAKGEGYADAPELIERLASEKLAGIEAEYRAQGWQQVRASLERPDEYYSLSFAHPEGQREPSDTERAEIARIDAAMAARWAEIEPDEQWSDEELCGLRHDKRQLEVALAEYSAEQKAECTLLLLIGREGQIEVRAIRPKRAKDSCTNGAPAEKPDYSGAMIETLSRIKTLAVQEAVAADPMLAFDILLDCLAGQIVHDEPGYHSPLALRLDHFNCAVPDDMMTISQIAPVADIGAAEFAALPQRDRFAAIRAMDMAAKHRLLALLVASQIDGSIPSGTRPGERHGRFAAVAAASGLDMTTKWEAPVAFYDRLKKPVILKIMAEELGQSAADNCAKMKKGDLAIAAVERLAGRGWLPQPLRIGAAEAESVAAASQV
jgi:ParB family chromosome partitioning protein